MWRLLQACLFFCLANGFSRRSNNTSLRPVASVTEIPSGGANSQRGEKEIRQVIATYFESISSGDAEKVREAFHPNAKIAGYLEGSKTLKELSVEEFASFLKKSPTKGQEELRSEVLNIVMTRTTAVALVRYDYDGMTYLDILSFLKAHGKWHIYSKVFHVEGVATW